MRRIIFSLLLAVLLLSFVSANIILPQPPKGTYNMGDTVLIPVKITTLTDINTQFKMYIICNGIQTNIYSNRIKLSAGQQVELTPPPTVYIIQDILGRTTGSCVVKSVLGSEEVLTEKFQISDIINIGLNFNKSEVAPEENIVISGEATKENEGAVQGFVLLRVTGENSTIIEITDAVTNGYFYLNFSLPKETKAGPKVLTIEIYEEHFRLSSDVGTSELLWTAVKEVWSFPEFILVFLSKAQFFTLPISDLGKEGRDLILAKARAKGAKIAQV